MWSAIAGLDHDHEQSPPHDGHHQDQERAIIWLGGAPFLFYRVKDSKRQIDGNCDRANQGFKGLLKLFNLYLNVHVYTLFFPFKPILYILYVIV